MKRVCLLACCAVLSGCIHAGEAKKEPVAATQQVKQELSIAAVEKTIVKGKTTTKELTTAFGAPNSVKKNPRALPKEVLEKVKDLPPIARTVEFWNYWTTPSQAEMDRSTSTGEKINVFRLMAFVDANGVVVDYLSETKPTDFSQPGSN